MGKESYFVANFSKSCTKIAHFGVRVFEWVVQEQRLSFASSTMVASWCFSLEREGNNLILSMLLI